MKIPVPRLISKKGKPEKWYMQVMVKGNRESRVFSDKNEAVYWATGIKTEMMKAEKVRAA